MIGLSERFKGNRATDWGTLHESTAASLFHDFIRGHVEMNGCAFDVLRGCDRHGRSLEWIGASPDGLLMPIRDGGGDDAVYRSDGSRQPHTRLGNAPGVLEIKCPYKLCALFGHALLGTSQLLTILDCSTAEAVEIILPLVPRLPRCQLGVADAVLDWM